MAQVLQSNNLMKIVVAVVLTVLLIGVMMIPVINALGEDKEVTTTVTLSNNGSTFALANADSESHPIIMSVDGDKLIVTSDGSPVSTGLGNVLPSIQYIKEDYLGPFNTYYVAINLASGDNSDDAGEERLSKEKGEIAYILDADNLRQTINGYTYDTTLYNIMLVIPPVYWYSEMDAPTEENPSPTTGKLYMASSPDAFESMGISASNMKDYAHTYTDNSVVGHSPAIMIGVYKAYNDNGVIVSQPDRTATTKLTAANWVSYANAGNTDVSMGTYQIWNYYMWTLYRIMGWTVLGNMDTHYMMGNGVIGYENYVTGSTDSAYTKSINNSSISLFIEDPVGGPLELIGDIDALSKTTISAGNTLGGVSDFSNVVNTLSEHYSYPASDGWITTIYTSPELFGLSKTTVSGSYPPYEPGNGAYGTSGSKPVNSNHIPVWVGGRNPGGITDVGRYNLNTMQSNGYTWASAVATHSSRLSYVVTDSSFTVPDGADKDYAYIMSYDKNGTIQNVQSIEDGVSTSFMPTNTVLNPYWGFGTVTIPPQLSDATNSVDLAVGSDSILQFYNSGNVVLQTATGTVDLGRVNDVTPTPVTVTVQNGVMTYTGGSANVSLYRSDSGTYVYATNNINVLNNAEIYVAQYQYGVETSNGTKDMGMIGSGTSETLSANVSLFNTANVDTETVNADITTNENYSKINSLSIETVFTDTDTLDYGVAGFYVPKTGSYEITTIERGGGMAYELLLFMPVLLILALIVLIAGSWYFNRTY